MRIVGGLALSAAVTLVATVSGVAASGFQPAAPVGQVAVVQALPGVVVELRIDGETVSGAVAEGDVLGPYEVAAGQHRIDFVAPGVDQAVTVGVQAGGSHDVVLHATAGPDSSDNTAAVTTYRTPTRPLGSGKARVLIAHAASAGAADVRVAGQTVFTDVTNGEFAVADVPAGTHAVTLQSAGAAGGAWLGPLDVALPEHTITMVYALGGPGDMTVVSHSLRLADDGSVLPAIIGTGSAGLASDVKVEPFG